MSGLYIPVRTVSVEARSSTTGQTSKSTDRTTAPSSIMNKDRKHLNSTIAGVFATLRRDVSSTSRKLTRPESWTVIDEHVTERSRYPEDFAKKETMETRCRTRTIENGSDCEYLLPTHETAESCRDARRNKCDCTHGRVHELRLS